MDWASGCWKIVWNIAETIGHRFDLAQVNLSVSAAGVLRGVHFADVPPGQAKYVTCPTGAILDVIVDIRVGSPTFGTYDTVLLDDTDRRLLRVLQRDGLPQACAQARPGGGLWRSGAYKGLAYGPLPHDLTFFDCRHPLRPLAHGAAAPWPCLFGGAGVT